MSSRLFMSPVLRIAGIIILAISMGSILSAQSLNWEGQSGGVVTPFAYTVESKVNSVSLPAVSFHLLSGGKVLGTHYYTSVTVGFLNRVEVGFSRASVSSGRSETLSKLFDRGFSIIHGKVILLAENSAKRSMPAISAGFVVRYQQKHIEGGLGSATQNGDFFLAATKTFNRIKQAPIILSGGVKVTNASLMGLAGNSPGWTLGGFLFAGVNLGSRVLVGAEYAQQPKKIKGIAGANVPGTVAFLARLVPDAKARLSIGLALVRLGGEIGEGLDIKADNRLSFGAGYRF